MTQLTHIVDLRLKDLQKLLADRKITLELTDGARKAIFKAGYDRAYGARPLKRAIQRMVQDKLAVKILDGSVLHGDHVVVEAGKDGLEFKVAGREREPFGAFGWLSSRLRDGALGFAFLYAIRGDCPVRLRFRVRMTAKKCGAAKADSLRNGVAGRSRPGVRWV